MKSPRMIFRCLVDSGEAPLSRFKQIANFSGVFLVCSLVCYWLLSETALRWEAVLPYQQTFLRGWLTTLLLSLVALALSLLLGTVAALARRSQLLPLRYLAILYVETIRGMPLLVLLLLAFYGIADKLRFDDRYVVGVITLSLFTGAYIAEMVRAGIESVGKSQLESARAIGLTSVQTYRFVIFPQAVRQILPPLAGQFASLIKDSSLLSILGVFEFTQAAQQVNSATYSTLECYIPLAVGYLILTVPISLLSRHLENKLRYET